MRIFLELGAMIHFLWLKHTAKQATLSELEEIYGKDVLSLCAVMNWTATFSSGCTEFADLPRSRRLCDTGKVDAVRALTEGEGDTSQKKIALPDRFMNSRRPSNISRPAAVSRGHRKAFERFGTKANRMND
jgi:hypothetical protein